MIALLQLVKYFCPYFCSGSHLQAPPDRGIAFYTWIRPIGNDEIPQKRIDEFGIYGISRFKISFMNLIQLTVPIRQPGPFTAIVGPFVMPVPVTILGPGELSAPVRSAEHTSELQSRESNL